jgi:cytochrome c-type biogenesis protein CcmH
MTLWFILGTMTAAALAAVVWPLARGRAVAAGVSDLAVYRDQLEEIERDRADGRIGHDEFEAARVEVSRRLLGAAQAGAAIAAPSRARRVAALAGAVVALPLVAVPFYALVGSPGLPGEPLASRGSGEGAIAEHQSQERRAGEREANELAVAIARIEQHLQEHPDDGRGWEVIAPVYLRFGRFDDAVKARRNALKLLGATAQREVELGVTLAMAAGGEVTEESKAAFDRAAAIEPGHVQAMFFLGVAAQQAGNETEAVRIWRDLIARAPPNAPWVPAVRERLALIAPGAAPPPVPGPTSQDVAATQDMAPEAREQFIHAMVERLAGRLHEDGSDVEGWLRLLRAYVVMGERDKARTAANEAREALAREPDKLKLLEAGLRSLGVQVPDQVPAQNLGQNIGAKQ